MTRSAVLSTYIYRTSLEPPGNNLISDLDGMCIGLFIHVCHVFMKQGQVVSIGGQVSLLKLMQPQAGQAH